MDIILDTETTGLRPEIDELLQVSIIDTHGAVLLDEYVKPDRATEWTEAMRINGITPEMVANARSIRDPYLHAKIQHIINSADKIIGYNVMFDIAFLAAAGFDVPNNDELTDVMIDFAEIYGDWREETQSYKWQKLTTAADYYGYEWTVDAHNSLGDCLATLYVYQCMQDAARLRACPFCGSDRVQYVPDAYEIRCRDCLTRITVDCAMDRDDVIRAYNRRATDQAHETEPDSLRYEPELAELDEDEYDSIGRCERCGTYVAKESICDGICAMCQADDAAERESAKLIAISEVIKEVLPDEE